MKTGFDPSLNKQLTVRQYHAQYGPKLDDDGNERSRQILICPACDSALHTVGEASGLVDATWAHDPDPRIWCPIKDTGAVKYQMLTPTEPDEIAAAQLRLAFFANWRLHWGMVRDFANFAGVETFIGFIKHADRTNLWAHVGLPEWHLPYICLATCDFPPPKGKAAAYRSTWLRFRFDAKLRTIEDLWIKVIPDLRFLTLRYRKPRSGEPTVSHYIDCQVDAPTPTWLTRAFRAPHPHAVGAMLAAFPKELGPR